MLRFSEIILMTPEEIRNIRRYTVILQSSVIRITIDRSQLPNHKVVASTVVINKDTQLPVPQFKTIFIINNVPKPASNKITTVFTPTPNKLVNITVKAVLPIPGFVKIKTVILSVQKSEQITKVVMITE